MAVSPSKDASFHVQTDLEIQIVLNYLFTYLLTTTTTFKQDYILHNYRLTVYLISL